MSSVNLLRNKDRLVSEPSLLQKKTDWDKGRPSGKIDGAQAQKENIPLPDELRDDPPLRGLSFSSLIEKRLEEFLRKTRRAEGGNLYNLLVQEVERPLIKLVLEETRGNQVQAAQLLGIHRNTLRKKVKELNIPSPRKKQR